MPMPERLVQEIAAHLAGELGDRAAAEELTAIIGAEALSWRAPEVAPNHVTTILAFTFGNRMHLNGNRQPGPVNEALADVAVRLHRESGARIYGQWEVAEAIGDGVPRDKLVAIYPQRDERAEPLYLSTSGVVREVLRLAGDAVALGRVGVVAFADHAWRCVATCRRFGIAAAVPASYVMPRQYDALSGQPWCRSRLAYLLHDIAIRAAERRDVLIAGG
jgi:hypothetical protein